MGVQVPLFPPKVRKNLNPSAKDVKGEAFCYMPKEVGDWKYDARYLFQKQKELPSIVVVNERNPHEVLAM